MVVVILVITLATFLIFYTLPPGDPALLFAGKTPSPEILEEVRQQFGLDKPLLQQYGTFVRNLFLGDEYGWPGLGFSFDSRSPIKDSLFGRVSVTFALAIGAAVVWLLIGILVGIVSALNRRKMVDRLAMGFALFGVSAPVFAVGLIALFIFAYQLGWSPGTGYVPITQDVGGWFSHLWLPWCVLALQYAAFYARMVRGNLLDALGEDYIRTARAKGLSERKVIGKHGLRSSLTPVVTIFGLDFSVLLGGAVLTETVFNLPGVGQYIVRAAALSDIPVVLAATVLLAFFVTFMSLVVDILYAYLDPRVRLT
jgi:peptide/nickel transport system permease protein